MKKAIEKVKAEPEYGSKGEVCTRRRHCWWIVFVIPSITSGWLQMLGMIRRQMHITRRSLVCQEGIWEFVVSWMRIIHTFIQHPSTNQILACSTVSRKEHQTAQTRELQCTKEVLPQLLEQGISRGSPNGQILIFKFVFIRSQHCRSGTRPPGAGNEVRHWRSETKKLLRHMAW